MKYSIITPVFNREDCILHCLESVTRNVGDRTDVEQIVVDDGSTDGTARLIREYGKAHSHVHFIQFLQNRGTNAARNAALSQARGRFSIFLDSDDYWDDAALTILDETIDGHPDVRHFCFAYDAMLAAYARNPTLSQGRQVFLSYEDFLMGRVHGDFVHVMDTEVMRRNPFDEEVRIYEGVFLLQCYKEAGTVLFTNCVVSHCERSREDSVSRAFLRTSKTLVDREIRADEFFISKYSKDLGCQVGGVEFYTNINCA